MATATDIPASQNSETNNANPNPNSKTLTLTTTDLNDPKVSKEGGAKEDTSAATVVSPKDDTVQKKVRRAERFGVPVQLSEEEKRNSRAERFGIGGGSETTKASEELKRKARAERFGTSVPADEEMKKKARLARFGSETKIDPAEEEKRKARALRFSQSSDDASHVNENGDIGSNSAIEGSTAGGGGA